MVSVVFVSHAGSGELSVLALRDDGALTPIQRLSLGGQIMPLACSPDGRRLYVARRSPPLALLGFAVDPASGLLSPLGQAPLPHSMAYLATDGAGRYVLSASYDGDLVAVSPLDARGAPLAVQQVVATGRHAHAIRCDPANRHAWATSLGGHRLHTFDFDARSGRLTAHAPPDYALRAGAGPRHLVFHPSAPRAYVLNELDACIDVLSIDVSSGRPALRHTVPTLAERAEGLPWAAELRLTPDARRLYTSERRTSTIAGFAVDDCGDMLTPLGRWTTQTQPRAFAIDPSGRFVIVAGQGSDRVGVHRIDPRTGALTPVGEHDAPGHPSAVESIALR